ncbi:MAG: hypothetical protein IJ404_07100 [Clostridia bacterium]|nr:hypothetical protein [Clostridia bacterium]
MIFSLPGISQDAIKLPHFPTHHQAFIFRAYEYVPVEKIAKVLKTTVENVRRAAHDMGLPDYNPGDLWLKRGYITIIRRMWHVLPYSQLLELLDLDEAALSSLMRDEDFLNVKLQYKPHCDEVIWRELTEDEKRKTENIRGIMKTVDISGKKPFEFEYNVPDISFGGEEKFKTRMIYAFSGLYQHAFDIDSEEYLPDDQLEAYKKLGVNGIWTQGILSQLAEFSFDPTVSDGYEKRLARMKTLTERLDRFGIKLYLYVNEPRSMPLAFFDKYPDVRGHIRGDEACLCTSTVEVQNYLKNAIEKVCRAVPLIGGFFSITRSENLTNCYSHTGGNGAECVCPRCRTRSVGEVIGETVGCFLEGARRVSDDIKVFAWSWRWDEFSEDVISHLPDGVILLSQSELDVPFDIGGVNGNVLDYSMSIIGPGELAKREWRLAKERGLEVGAKVQINTTWEASTVPAIPVSPSIDEHMKLLEGEGIRHLLLSWTLGGYPCRNIAVAAKHFFEKCSYSSHTEYYEAEKVFAEAFKEFPFHIDVLYMGPQNAGPSSMLFDEPTGYRATMTCFAYDDLEGWRGIYPVDVFEKQFDLLCQKWKIGLDMLPENDESESAVMARAAYCLFKSSFNQIRFVRARNESRYSDALAAAESELDVAKEMLVLMNVNASIGYEAANHYYFSKGQLAEKIVNCHYIIESFSKKL